MGLTYVDADLFSGSAEVRTIHFLVDSGASYSLLPEPIWSKLGGKSAWDGAFQLSIQ